jgi:F-type H+-transporting ATPase subunit alpha
MEEQVVAIFAGVRGYLDGIDVADINRFEAQLLDHIREKNADILTAIRDDGAISDDTEAKLKDVMDAFTRAFA